MCFVVPLELAARTPATDDVLMTVLALDIGRKRTGVAHGDPTIGIAFPLPTIAHDSIRTLSTAVHALIDRYNVRTLIVGLPLLPSGDEGEQATFVRQTIDDLSLPERVIVEFLDERYTSFSAEKTDLDALAACQLLEVYFMVKKKIDK